MSRLIDEWMPDVPQTDEEVLAKFKKDQIGDLHCEILSNLYMTRRKLGMSVFKAYEMTLIDSLPAHLKPKLTEGD